MTRNELLIMHALEQEPMTVAELSLHCDRIPSTVRAAVTGLVRARLVRPLSRGLDMGDGRKPAEVYRRVATWERAA